MHQKLLTVKANDDSVEGVEYIREVSVQAYSILEAS